MVPQMISFSQIGKSSILFSPQKRRMLSGFARSLPCFPATRQCNSCALAGCGSAAWMAAIDLNKEDRLSFIEGARSRSGRRFIGGAVCSAWRRQRRGNFDTKACRCRGVTVLVVDVDRCDERSSGIWNGNGKLASVGRKIERPALTEQRRDQDQYEKNSCDHMRSPRNDIRPRAKIAASRGRSKRRYARRRFAMPRCLFVAISILNHLTVIVGPSQERNPGR
jgi:hypothetical protein